jgi:hypothetical protein
MDSLAYAKKVALRAAKWSELQEDSYGIARRPERVPEVSELRQRIKALGVKDLDYFGEGLDCIQYAQAPRAAIVMAWAGFIDMLQLKFDRDKYAALNAILKFDFHGVHKRLGQVKTRDDLIGHFDDALLLQASKKLGWLGKHAFTQLDAMRDERNNCAHVEEYAVTPRTALGFYDKIITYLPQVL